MGSSSVEVATCWSWRSRGVLLLLALAITAPVKVLAGVLAALTVAAIVALVYLWPDLAEIMRTDGLRAVIRMHPGAAICALCVMLNSLFLMRVFAFGITRWEEHDRRLYLNKGRSEHAAA